MKTPALRDLAFELEFRTPSEAARAPRWLEELRAFRGRELFANGRRPAFQIDANTFVDADPHDLHSFHVMMRSPESGEIVGCNRLMPLDGSRLSQVEAAVGRDRAEEALKLIGATRQSTVEGGRWIVRREERGKGIGPWLVLCGFALCQVVGYRFIWSTAGVRDGQTEKFIQLGHYPIPGFKVFSSERYADEICLIFADMTRLSPALASQVEVLLPEVRARFAAPPSSRRKDLSAPNILP